MRAAGPSGPDPARPAPARGGQDATRGLRPEARRSGEVPRGGTPGGRGPAARPERVHDPRRDERRALTRVELPDDVDGRDLDPEVREDLRSLAKDTADLVARHLVATGRLLDEDPQRALAHARAAGALAGRVGAVREAVGLAAYAAQEWAEALSELRAARRISGRADHVAVLADCERGLGRPERALALLNDPDVPRLEQAVRVELVIVGAGARRDLGQSDAAVLLLQGPARATTARRPWATRLWYAYADALLEAGREDEARQWFAKAAEHDGQGETDAMERLLVLDGVVIEDLQVDEDGDDEPPPVDLAALLAAPVPPRVEPVVSEPVVSETVVSEPEATAPQSGTSLPDGAPAPEEPADEHRPASEHDRERGVVEAPTPLSGVGAPLFSHRGSDGAVGPTAPASVPAVAFTPPPDEPAEDGPDEPDNRED